MLLLRFSMSTSRACTGSAHLLPLLWMNAGLIFHEQARAGFVCPDQVSTAQAPPSQPIHSAY